MIKVKGVTTFVVTFFIIQRAEKLFYLFLNAILYRLEMRKSMENRIVVFDDFPKKISMSNELVELLEIKEELKEVIPVYERLYVKEALYKSIVNKKPIHIQHSFIKDTSHFMMKGVLEYRDNIIYSNYEMIKYNASVNRIMIRTFGYFDVFVNGKPIVFTSLKEKELLALFISKVGGVVSSELAITYLWEDELFDAKLRNRYSKLLGSLKKTLRKYHIEDVLTIKNGDCFINAELIICDFYEVLKENEAYYDYFDGSYMIDFTWAEELSGWLTKFIEKKKRVHL